MAVISGVKLKPDFFVLEHAQHNERQVQHKLMGKILPQKRNLKLNLKVLA